MTVTVCALMFRSRSSTVVVDIVVVMCLTVNFKSLTGSTGELQTLLKHAAIPTSSSSSYVQQIRIISFNVLQIFNMSWSSFKAVNYKWSPRLFRYGSYAQVCSLCCLSLIALDGSQIMSVKYYSVNDAVDKLGFKTLHLQPSIC